MPEDLKTYILRVYEHARKHLGMMSDCLNEEEYDTCDFLASVVVNDLIELRNKFNALLRFKQRG